MKNDILFICMFLAGFLAGFGAHREQTQKETIKAQEKQFENTVRFKNDVCEIEKEIKRYEINCADILNFDISSCL